MIHRQQDFIAVNQFMNMQIIPNSLTLKYFARTKFYKVMLSVGYG
jgi:hypothetical protein